MFRAVVQAFSWLATPSTVNWGFIAQDVQPVMPEAVTQGPEDPAGNPGKLSLDITALLAAAIYTIKQLDARCTALEAAASITPPASSLA